MKTTKFLFCISILTCSISSIQAEHGASFDKHGAHYTRSLEDNAVMRGNVHSIYESFHKAVSEGDIPEARKWIRKAKKGAELLGRSSDLYLRYADIVNFHGGNSASALNLAITSVKGEMMGDPKKRSSMVQFLVENGAATKRDRWQITQNPILVSCAQSVGNYLSPNEPAGHGEASLKELIKIVQYLIDNGADVNDWDGGGLPPLEHLLNTYKLCSNPNTRGGYYNPEKAELCWEFIGVLVKNGAYLDEVGDTWPELKTFVDDLSQFQE